MADTSYILNPKLPVEIQGKNIEENGLLRVGDSTRLIYPVGDIKLLDIPTYDGSNQPVHPSVVYIPQKFGGYCYWMAFTPYPDGDASKENPSIVASNDGINWEVPKGLTNPIEPAPSTGYFADISIIYDGSKLHVYWHHFGITPTKKLKKTSNDGVNWGAAIECTSATMFADETTVFLGDNIWTSWTKGRNGMLAQRFSADGVTFSRPWEIPTTYEGRIGHFTVYHDGVGYHMLANMGTKYVTPQSMSLYYGYSKNGTEFVFDPIPLLVPTPGTWYDKTMYTASMVPGKNGVFYIYFSVSGHKTPMVRTGLLKVRLTNHIIPPKNHSKILFDGVQVRDNTTWLNSPYCKESGLIYDWGLYKNRQLVINNSHNQPVEIRMLHSPSNLGLELYMDNEKQVIDLPTGQYAIHAVTKETFKGLGSNVMGPIKFQVKGKTAAPTTGDLSIQLVMWND